MTAKYISIPKYPDSSYINEDAVGGDGHRMAVSDGAGGGGVYADRWSAYLVDNLPDTPITTFEELDAWVDGIWEQFYQEYEAKAKMEGGLLLNKFYDEGSFATLAAAWMCGDSCQWMTYGDSVVFCYNKKSHTLEHSFGELAAFDNPPYLINFNNPLKNEGFRSGRFEWTPDSIYFAASDALSHYIIMMYEICHESSYQDELQTAIQARSRNSNAIRMGMGMKKFDFEKDVIGKLLHCVKHRSNMQKHISALKRRGLLLEDDYSFITIEP